MRSSIGYSCVVVAIVAAAIVGCSDDDHPGSAALADGAVGSDGSVDAPIDADATEDGGLNQAEAGPSDGGGPSCDQRPTHPMHRIPMTFDFTQPAPWTFDAPYGSRLRVTFLNPNGSPIRKPIAPSSFTDNLPWAGVRPATTLGRLEFLGLADDGSASTVLPQGTYDVYFGFLDSDRQASRRVFLCGDTDVTVEVPRSSAGSRTIRVRGLDAFPGSMANYELFLEAADHTWLREVGVNPAALADITFSLKLPDGPVTASLRYTELPRENYADNSGLLRLTPASDMAANELIFDLPPLGFVTGTISDPSKSAASDPANTLFPSIPNQEIWCFLEDGDVLVPSEADPRRDHFSVAQLRTHVQSYSLVVPKGARCNLYGVFPIKLGAGAPPGAAMGVDPQWGTLFMPRPGADVVTVAENLKRDFVIKGPLPVVSVSGHLLHDGVPLPASPNYGVRATSITLSPPDWSDVALSTGARSDASGTLVLTLVPGTYQLK
jgi:hypothetical protein